MEDDQFCSLSAPSEKPVHPKKRLGARALSMPVTQSAPLPRPKPFARAATMRNFQIESKLARLHAAVWAQGDNGAEGEFEEVKRRRSNHTQLLASLRRIAGLGVGQFGCVSLVQDPDGRSHALKSLWKGHLIHTQQVEHVISECRLLAELSHPFIAKLQRVFQDERKVHLLMEPVLGGELYALLHVMGRLEERFVQFYTCCVTIVLQHLHGRRIVYRDLKPENLLIDEHGYLKLVDFGLAKTLEPADAMRTRTICGTPEYLAPEMVRGEPYGVSVDWWALGILMFEMLSGVPAFRGRDNNEIYSKILHQDPVLLVDINAACAAVLRGLLCKEASERMTAEETIASPFCAEIDFAALAARQVQAPYVPYIQHDTDTSNVVQIEKYINPANEEDGREWDRYLYKALLTLPTDPFEELKSVQVADG